MSALLNADGVDPELLAGWVAARSIARGVAAPVADHGGWRVDTRSDVEYCRYIFVRGDAAIATLAHSIHQPRILIKACVEEAALIALLPDLWALQDRAWVMTSLAEPPARRLAEGYTLAVEHENRVIAVTVTAADGSLAASGYAVEIDGVFAYDRIRTSADHQRRGLGHAVMSTLHAQRRSVASREILVATDEGRALYTALGWSVQSAYASALSPPAS
ncbi:GNAT family N-acetyltransferase [Sphingomonas sp. UYP23]